MTHYLIFGASRGLGALFSQSLPKSGDTVWLVSRTQPYMSKRDGIQRIWIQADLADSRAASHIAEVIGETNRLDVCLYNAGIWEETAFSPDYNYEQVSAEEIAQIVQVNLVSAMTGVQKMLPALRRSSRGKIIFIGSNAGLENSKRPEVAYAATKFALRGLTHALREVVREDGIGVTCLNLGDVGTVEVVDGKVEVAPDSSGRALIALADIVIMLKAVIELSNTSCAKEIDLLAMTEDI